MIKREFIEYLADKIGTERKELIEKDVLLQALLIELTKDAKFKDDYVFKGGTCLIKCYLGYYRFSEDLDFSYIIVKSRDFIDVFLILRKTGRSFTQFRNEIIEKTVFILRYEKYYQNIKLKMEYINKEDILEEEQKLLLNPISKDFEIFLDEFIQFIQVMIKELTDVKK